MSATQESLGATVVRQNVGSREIERRRVRKGTRSCWECKKRKMRCTFISDPQSTACYACLRRGSRCLTQEFPERSGVETRTVMKSLDGCQSADSMENKTPVDSANGLKHSAVHDPARSSLIQQSASNHDVIPQGRLSMLDRSQTSGIFANGSSLEHRDHHTAALNPMEDKQGEASGALRQALPCEDDIKHLYSSMSEYPAFAYEIMTMPYTCTQLTEHSTDPRALPDAPGADSHPILLARFMLLLASILQHMRPDRHAPENSVFKSPLTSSKRLADAAINLAIIKDEHVGSIAALECILIESVYHANCGDLRRSWMTCRKALNIAQLLGLDPPYRPQYEVLNHRTLIDPKALWARIVFLDRLLCLLLGLPQGCENPGMNSSAFLLIDVSMQRLERIHCVVASFVIERSGPDSRTQGIAIARALDKELQKASRSIPGDWWLLPRLEDAQNSNRSILWSTGKIYAQVLHYNLLNQLHLPYMFASSHSLGERIPEREYSRMACVSASREMISRFIALRDFNNLQSSCRMIDYLALMAAITLALAHLDSSRLESDNLLGHHYHGDHALIRRVQQNLRQNEVPPKDTMRTVGLDVLDRLLRIEHDPASATARNLRVGLDMNKFNDFQAESAGDDVLNVRVPYFGAIKISQENMDNDATDPALDAFQRSAVGHETINDSTCGLLDGTIATGSAFEGTAYNRAPGVTLSPQILARYGAGQTSVAAEMWQNDGFPGNLDGIHDMLLEGDDFETFQNLMRINGA